MLTRKSAITSTLMLLISSLTHANDTRNWSEIQFIAKNKLDLPLQKAEICISDSELSDQATSSYIVSNGSKLEHQVVGCDGGDEPNDIQLLVDFDRSETKQFTVYSHPLATAANSPELRTLAELAVRVGGTMTPKGRLVGGTYVPVEQYTLPKKHSIGDHLFKYEGIGIESNQVAYRYYFDHRGSIDIFGKSTASLVLPQVGLDGTDYHQLNDWGMDVLKVGNSFGIGAPGAIHDGVFTRMSNFKALSARLYSGLHSSGFSLQFDDWVVGETKTDAKVRYTMNYDDAKVKVRISSDKSLDHWATGIVNHGMDLIYSSSKNSEWGYMATFGKQSLAGDNLGMAIFFKTGDVIKRQRDDANHTLVLGRNTNSLEYYFLADWQGGIGGSAAIQQFKNKLNKELQILNSPIQIQFTK